MPKLTRMVGFETAPGMVVELPKYLILFIYYRKVYNYVYIGEVFLLGCFR